MTPNAARTLGVGLGALTLGALMALGAWGWLGHCEPVAPPGAAMERPRAALEETLRSPADQTSETKQERAQPVHASVLSAVALQRGRDLPEAVAEHPGHVRPHPLSDARLRVAEQRRMFTQIKDALHENDFDAARRLLQQHDAQFQSGEAWSDLREGYQLIADCGQYGDAASRERGRRFVAEQGGSTLRRSVRRACIRDTH